METTRTVRAYRRDATLGSIATITLLTLAVAVGEALLFYGEVWYAIVAYSVLLFSLSLAPLAFETDISILQVFLLIPLFRLVNLTMPVFFEQTLLWLPLVYGPFIVVIVYMGRRAIADAEGEDATAERAERDSRAVETGAIGAGLPRWLGGTRGSRPRRVFSRLWHSLAVPEGASSLQVALRWLGRGLLVALVPVVVAAVLVGMGVATVYFAELEYSLTTPVPLVPSLAEHNVALLIVVMVGFVGFVEELLFRGVLQQVLEHALGVVPGLLLASAIFGLMHSGTGVPSLVLFAAGVGLFFGVVYDLTDSLALVAVSHGLLNTLLFGLIPLDGGSAVDLLLPVVDRFLRSIGAEFLVEGVGWLELLIVAAPF